jgi:hypothetical protein
MFKITKSYIESLATNQSFSRGKSYYQRGEVSSVVQKGNTFIGEVSGSDTYRIKIIVDSNGITSTCSCPYDWGGICKHVVAVGLAIADGDFKKDSSYMPESDFFDRIFPHISPEILELFWQKCLREDGSKRAELMEFAGIKIDKAGNVVLPKKITDNSAIDIDELADEVREAICEFDFDYSGQSKRHYRNEGSEDIYYDFAIKHIKKVLNEKYALYYNNSDKQFISIFKLICALYEGTQDLDSTENGTPDAEDYGYDDDQFTDWCKIEIDELLQNVFTEKLIAAPKTEQIICEAIDIWIERLLIAQEHDELAYDFRIWQTIVETLLLNNKVANYILEQFKLHDLVQPSSAKLVLMLADMLDNTPYWMEVAEQFAPQDKAIALALFDKYAYLHQKTDMLRIAKSLFSRYPTLTDEYLITHLSPTEDRSLFLQIATHLAARKEDMNGYQFLKQLWTAQEKQDFIAQQRAKEVFYVQLLVNEERLEDAFKYVKNRIDSFNFAGMIRPIINQFPLEIIELLTQKIDRALQLDKSRKTYSSIAEWLSPLLDINDEKEAVSDFIESIILKYPKLVALKDELKRAQLIK